MVAGAEPTVPLKIVLPSESSDAHPETAKETGTRKAAWRATHLTGLIL